MRGREVGIWSGVGGRPFSLPPIKFDIFLHKSCKPFKPVTPGLVCRLHSPQGPILETEIRKGQGLCVLEGTGQGRVNLGGERQPGTEPGEGQAARKKKVKGPK